MRKLFMGIAVVAMFAVPSVAMAAPATGSTTCTDSSDLQGKVINSNVTVPAGATCNLSWSDIKGNVAVNGSLVTYGQTHFEKNVSINGGSFAAMNWGVTIDGNLSFLNPAVYSYNGFWGNQGGTSNLVKGNLTYTITSDTVYPDYQSPLLYFGGGTTVNGTFNYSDQGSGFPGHLDKGGLNVLNHS
jgi:hypothetical protein